MLFLLCFLLVRPLWAQNADSLNQQKELQIIPAKPSPVKDSARIRILRNTEDPQKSNHVSELFILGKNAYKKGSSKPINRYSPFQGHWSGFYYGFVNYADLPETWKTLELDWGHSFAMQFNLCKYSINLSRRNNLGLVTGIGLEYQRLRFNNDNISILKSDGDLEIIHPLQEYPEMTQIKRSTLKNLYLTVPLMMEVQFPARYTKRMYISAGIMGGLRMHSKTKMICKDEDGNKYKKKKKGNFNMIPFKADAIARIGYRNINIWGSYTLTNMFNASNVPDLHLYTVGLGFAF